MTDSSSDCEESEALSVLIPDLLRRVLPETPSELGSHPSAGAPHIQHSSNRSNSNSAVLQSYDLPQREEAAETLCDLTASATCAQIIVDCSGLQILPEIANHALGSTQHRLAELSIGIMANILCHATLATQVSTHCAVYLSRLRLRGQVGAWEAQQTTRTCCIPAGFLATGFQAVND